MRPGQLRPPRFDLEPRWPLFQRHILWSDGVPRVSETGPRAVNGTDWTQSYNVMLSGLGSGL